MLVWCKLQRCTQDYCKYLDTECLPSLRHYCCQTFHLRSSVIRKKGESQNGCFKNTKYVKHVCVSEGKKCSFFGKFGVLCFLETFVLRFTLLPYYRRIVRKTSEYSEFLDVVPHLILDIMFKHTPFLWKQC